MSDDASLRADLEKLRADFEASRRLIYDAGPRLGTLERGYRQLDHKLSAIDLRTKALAFGVAFSEATEKAARAAAWAVVRDHPTSGQHPGVDPADPTAPRDPNPTATVDEATLTLAFLEFAKDLLQGLGG